MMMKYDDGIAPMPRTATLYVNAQSVPTSGIRTLLANNGVGVAEVDLSDDPPKRAWVLARAAAPDLPVVELDGTFVGSVNIVRLAEALGLALRRVAVPPADSCC